MTAAGPCRMPPPTGWCQVLPGHAECRRLPVGAGPCRAMPGHAGPCRVGPGGLIYRRDRPPGRFGIFMAKSGHICTKTALANVRNCTIRPLLEQQRPVLGRWRLFEPRARSPWPSEPDGQWPFRRRPRGGTGPWGRMGRAATIHTPRPVAGPGTAPPGRPPGPNRSTRCHGPTGPVLAGLPEPPLRGSRPGPTDGSSR